MAKYKLIPHETYPKMFWIKSSEGWKTPDFYNLSHALRNIETLEHNDRIVDGLKKLAEGV